MVQGQMSQPYYKAFLTHEVQNMVGASSQSWASPLHLRYWNTETWICSIYAKVFYNFNEHIYAEAQTDLW